MKALRVFTDINWTDAKRFSSERACICSFSTKFRYSTFVLIDAETLSFYGVKKTQLGLRCMNGCPK